MLFYRVATWVVFLFIFLLVTPSKGNLFYFFQKCANHPNEITPSLPIPEKMPLLELIKNGVVQSFPHSFIVTFEMIDEMNENDGCDDQVFKKVKWIDRNRNLDVDKYDQFNDTLVTENFDHGLTNNPLQYSSAAEKFARKVIVTRDRVVLYYNELISRSIIMGEIYTPPKLYDDCVIGKTNETILINDDNLPIELPVDPGSYNYHSELRVSEINSHRKISLGVTGIWKNSALKSDCPIKTRNLEPYTFEVSQGNPDYSLLDPIFEYIEYIKNVDK